MKRVQLQLPDAVVAWIDAQADGIESRAGFIRRSIVALMKAEQRQQQISCLPAELQQRLGISAERWQEISLACCQRVVAWEAASVEPD